MNWNYVCLLHAKLNFSHENVCPKKKHCEKSSDLLTKTFDVLSARADYSDTTVANSELLYGGIFRLFSTFMHL